MSHEQQRSTRRTKRPLALNRCFRKSWDFTEWIHRKVSSILRQLSWTNSHVSSQFNFAASDFCRRRNIYILPRSCFWRMLFQQLGNLYIFVDMRVVVDVASFIELSGLLVEPAVVSHLLMFCNCMRELVTEMRTLISYCGFQLASLPEALKIRSINLRGVVEALSIGGEVQGDGR